MKNICLVFRTNDKIFMFIPYSLHYFITKASLYRSCQILIMILSENHKTNILNTIQKYLQKQQVYKIKYKLSVSSLHWYKIICDQKLTTSGTSNLLQRKIWTYLGQYETLVSIHLKNSLKCYKVESISLYTYHQIWHYPNILKINQ